MQPVCSVIEEDFNVSTHKSFRNDRSSLGGKVHVKQRRLGTDTESSGTFTFAFTWKLHINVLTLQSWTVNCLFTSYLFAPPSLRFWNPTTHQPFTVYLFVVYIWVSWKSVFYGRVNHILEPLISTFSVTKALSVSVWVSVPPLPPWFLSSAWWSEAAQ